MRQWQDVTGGMVLIRVITLALAVYALGTVFTLAQIKAKRQELMTSTSAGADL
ncbi:MAG: hypothetical protein ACLR4Z_01705 [Butyricicoccaceae bacterium]